VSERRRRVLVSRRETRSGPCDDALCNAVENLCRCRWALAWRRVGRRQRIGPNHCPRCARWLQGTRRMKIGLLRRYHRWCHAHARLLRLQAEGLPRVGSTESNSGSLNTRRVGSFETKI